jgi:hypothetical protein
MPHVAIAWSALSIAFPKVPRAADSPAPSRIVRFHFTPTAGTQLAIWVETPDGKFLQTVRLTQSVTRRGIGNRPGAAQMNSGFRWPYGRREGVLPVWAHRRAAADGALQFPRVIFQDRASEGDASRTSDDSTPDSYFCLSFGQAPTADLRRQQALDAVTCASQFRSDKGRFIRATDVAAGYAEPAEVGGQGINRALGMTSLYPPRRDIESCVGSDGCLDTIDTTRYPAEAERVMPDIDAITMATPPGGAEPSIVFTIPDQWPSGDYVAWLEVNVEGDYNATFNDKTYPTPTEPSAKWDSWAVSSGYAYRGQPSVVYKVPFKVDEAAIGATTFKASAPVGYGDVDGFGDHGGDLHSMDAMISDDPQLAKGSGADRLAFDAARDYRVMVEVGGCDAASVPGRPLQVSAAPVEDVKNSHRWGRLHFVVPDSPGGIDYYDIRFSSSPVLEDDPAGFFKAPQAVMATNQSDALMMRGTASAGSVVEVDFGGMQPLTEYWVGIRAVKCNSFGPIAVAQLKTTRINFTQLSGCFIATAAFGSPLAPAIQPMRQLRDQLRRSSDMFATAADLYYQAGPAAAALVGRSELTRAIVRAFLTPVAEASGAITAMENNPQIPGPAKHNSL